MSLENLCECGAWILQIEIMGAFFGVNLNMLRSGIRCYGKRRQSFELNKGFTVVKAIWWRVEWSIFFFRRGEPLACFSRGIGFP